MNKLINFPQTSLVLLTAIALTGCSSGPSESDAKAVVQASLGNCEYLSIDHFEKVNGTPQGSDHYMVDIKYSIQLKPTPDIKAYASEKYVQEVGNLKQQLAQAHQVENVWKANEQAWIQSNPGSTSGGYQIAHQDGWAEYQKVMPLLLNGDQLVSDAPRTAKAAMASAMRKSCPNVTSAVLNTLFSGDEPIEQYASEVKKTFTSAVTMVKTDNGWQENR